MKKHFLAPLCVAALVSLGAFAAPWRQDAAKPTEQHAWLKQLVGEWNATMEAAMAPGAEPMKIEFTEKIRALGDIWIVAECNADFGGMAMSTMMTLGYDPRGKSFVGTWVDTFQTHMWTYKGSLDDAKKVLTLEASGPHHSDPTKMANYRDVIELVAPDHKTLTSSMEGEDGEWTEFMKVDYRRKK